MNLKLIRSLTGLAINNPVESEMIQQLIRELVVQNHNLENKIREMYQAGASKLEIVKYYKNVTGAGLMDSKREIEKRFNFNR